MADKDHNLTERMKLISKAMGRIKDLKNERSDVNADIASERAAMVTIGIPKKAFDMAMAYMNMDPDDRLGFDVAYAVCREAAGLPMQDDLFSAADRLGKEKVAEGDDKKPKGPDAGAIAKVIESQENEKTKGKTVLPSSAGEGAIN